MKFLLLFVLCLVCCSFLQAETIDIGNLTQEGFEELIDQYLDDINLQLQTMQVTIEVDDWHKHIVCTMRIKPETATKRFAVERQRMRTIAAKLLEKLQQNDWAKDFELEFRQIEWEPEW